MTNSVAGTIHPGSESGTCFRTNDEFGGRYDGDLLFSYQCTGPVSGKVVRACLMSQPSELSSRLQ